jgi:hypothetical protein
MKGFDATQQARIHTDICARESRAAAKHAASDGAATFSLAATFKGEEQEERTRGKGGRRGRRFAPVANAHRTNPLPPPTNQQHDTAGALASKPNATRPSDWLVDEAGAAAAAARLAALAPRSRRRSDSGSGGGGGGDDWRHVLPPSSNGEYGLHTALINAAVKAEAAAEQQPAEKTTAAAGQRPAASMAETLRWSLGGHGKADGGVAEIWAPDNGRKSSSVTQFAAAYVSMLGHSPFSSRGR